MKHSIDGGQTSHPSKALPTGGSGHIELFQPLPSRTCITFCTKEESWNSEEI